MAGEAVSLAGWNAGRRLDFDLIKLRDESLGFQVHGGAFALDRAKHASLVDGIRKSIARFETATREVGSPSR